MADLPPITAAVAHDARYAALERLTPERAAALSRAVMQRQFALSARVAVVFLVLIFALPVLNWRAPDLASANVGGFTLTWLLLGVLFYPVTWLLSGYFVRASDDIEAAIARDNALDSASVRGKEDEDR